MFRNGWSAAAYTLALVSTVTGGCLLVSWLSPVGITRNTVVMLAFPAAGAALTGVLTWRIHGRRGRRPPLGFDGFLDSIPRTAWIVFATGHGVVLGALLALAWQAPFTPVMLGFGAVAGVAGAFLPELRERHKRTVGRFVEKGPVRDRLGP